MGRIDVLRDATRRAVRWLSTPAGFATIFAVGLLLRLWLARSGGFPYDVGLFRSWAGRLAERGFLRFYPAPGEEFFVDYPPGYLYILFILGKGARLLGQAQPPGYWTKLPPIAFDLVIAWVAARAAERLTPPDLGRRAAVRSLAAAVVLLNPAFFFISAVWGQVDSMSGALVLGGLYILGTQPHTARRESAGLMLLAAAIATKPQSAFVLPFVLGLLVWRHLRGPVMERWTASWRERAAAVLPGLARIAGLGLVAAAFGFLLLAPFGLTPAAAYRFYSHAASTYSVTSAFAFNIWGAVGFWRPDSGADAVRLFGIPAFQLGLALFALGSVLVVLRAFRTLRLGEDADDDGSQARVVLAGGAALNLIGFVVLTRIHERYLLLALALLAPLAAYRSYRRAIVALSAVYMVNVYFPFVFYIEYAGQNATKIPLFDVVYGADWSKSVQLKLWSVLTAAVALTVAWAGWRWLEARPDGSVSVLDRLRPAPPAADAPAQRWTLRLHEVGRRGALVALAVFAVAAILRVAWLGHPPGMYFDEVYHARTAGEYLQRKEVYEWTHPPLAKELMALSIRWLSGFGVKGTGVAPAGFDGPVAADGGRVVWASEDGVLRRGVFDGCGVAARGGARPAGLRPTAVAVSGGRTVVAGEASSGPAVVRFDGGRPDRSTTLPVGTRDVELIGDSTLALGEDDVLRLIGPAGRVATVAGGVHSMSEVRGDVVWVTQPDDRAVASYGAAARRRAVAYVRGRPGPITVPEHSERVVVADLDAPRLETVDTGSKTRADQVRIPRRAAALATVPETGLAWAIGPAGTQIVEPRGGSILGRIDTRSDAARVLVPDATSHRLVAVGDEGLRCLGGRPQFAWRLGSAVFGAAAVALVFLIGLRLFGSRTAALMAALFLGLDGLAFTMSRIAMNDSYVMAFLLAAWFAVLSALYRWGAAASDPDRRRSRTTAFAWLAVAGVTLGGAFASKWVGAYGAAGIGALLLWDITRRRDGIWWLAGSPAATVASFVVLLGAVPLGVYVASYLPYFGLGHTFGQLVETQRNMFNYHAYLTATHPYGSKWFAWPFGRRAVYLYQSISPDGAHRSDIWTIPNLVVFWGGLAALASAAWAALTRRSVTLMVIVVAALAQYMPWALVGRVTFLYHFLPVVPFLALALAWALTDGLRDAPYRRQIAVGVCVAAVAFFVATLPLLIGTQVPSTYLDTVKRALPWVF